MLSDASTLILWYCTISCRRTSSTYCWSKTDVNDWPKTVAVSGLPRPHRGTVGVGRRK